MGAAQRLGNQGIDQSQLLEALGGDPHGLGRIGRLVGALPQDRGAALGGDHRVGGVLQHGQLVADADGKRPAGATLAHHGGQHRCAQARHHAKVVGDGLRLAALLGVDAGVGAGGVDKGQHRHAEALGHLHQSTRLAVTLGTRHSEVAAYLLVDITPLLVADHHDRAVVEACHPADDGGIIGETAIAMKLVEIAEDVLQVVQGVGTLGMPRELRDLPRAEVLEDRLGELAALLLEALDLVTEADLAVVADQPELLDLGLELGDGLFEVEIVGVHWRLALWCSAGRHKRHDRHV